MLTHTPTSNFQQAIALARLCAHFISRTLSFVFRSEIYRWSIILADTNFFQQSVSVSAADFRGRNNRPSAKHFFIKLSAKLYLMHNIHMNFSSVISGVWWTLAEFWMNFGILCAHFGTLGTTEHWVTVPKCAHKIPKFCSVYLIFGRNLGIYK